MGMLYANGYEMKNETNPRRKARDPERSSTRLAEHAVYVLLV